MTGFVSLSLQQGVTFSTTIQIVDVNNNPYDLTGATLLSQMRRSYISTSPSATLIVTSNTPSTGLITLSLDSLYTSLLTPDWYVFDVLARYPDGTVYTLVRGTIKVIAGITNIRFGVNMSQTFSALNANADGSGLPRVQFLYETNILPGGTKQSPIVTTGIPLNQYRYIIDIESAYKPVEDTSYFTTAVSTVKSYVGANSVVSVFAGFPLLDQTAGSRQDTRDLYRGATLSMTTLGDTVDAFTPGIYMPDPTFTIVQWKYFVKRVFSACWENNPSKPVLPVMWHCYISNNAQIDSITWQEMIRYTRTLVDRADEGIIFWSGSWETTYLPRMVGL